jgi:hypothetical protein
MWAERAEATLPLPPEFDQLEAELEALEEHLASFREHPGTVLARRGQGLSADSRTRWEQARRNVREARATFHEVTGLLADARRRAAGTDSAPTLGRTAVGASPLPTVRRAINAVRDAIDLAKRIDTVHNDQLPRAERARDRASEAGEAAAATRASELAIVISKNPFEEHESDLRDVELAAVSPGLRPTRDRFARLGDLVREAAGVADHTASRILGFVSTGKALRDELDQLEGSLLEIDTSGAAGTGESPGPELVSWHARADDLEARACDAAKEARALLARRDRLRSMLDPLNETAARLGLREDPEVDALFHSLEDHLWIAPCDLDVAEALMATLVQRLDGREQGWEP